MPASIIKPLVQYILNNRDTLSYLNITSENASYIADVVKWYFNTFKRPCPRSWLGFWKYIYKIPETPETNLTLRQALFNAHEVWLGQYKSVQQRNMLRNEFIEHKSTLDEKYGK